MSSKSLLVIGGVALDITATIGRSAVESFLHTSTPGRVKQSLGGVGRNVAEAAWRTGGQQVKLLSVVGDDLAGESVRKGLDSIGMTTEYIQTLKDHSTAVYNALHSNDGQLVAAVADMDIFEYMNPDKVSSILKSEQPSFVCFDGNISSYMMNTIVNTCQSLSIPALFEPTSVPKSLKFFENYKNIQTKSVRYVTPNQFELEAIYDTVNSYIVPKPLYQTKKLNPKSLKNAPTVACKALAQAISVSNFIPCVITKLGEEGCLYVDSINSVVEYFPPEFILPDDIDSVTGAGDCFVGTLIANLQKHQGKIFDMNVMRSIIEKSQMSSILTLKSNLAVSEKISLANLLI